MYTYYENVAPGELFHAENDDGSYSLCIKVVMPNGEEAFITMHPNALNYEFGSPLMLVLL